MPEVSGIEKDNQDETNCRRANDVTHWQLAFAAAQLCARRKEPVPCSDSEAGTRQREKVNDIGFFGENHPSQAQDASLEVFRFSGRPDDQKSSKVNEQKKHQP